jgi:dethiobiotin synthetase
MRGLFITATDTGVGKSILSAALIAAIAAEGRPVRAYKPAVTGLEDAEEIAARGAWPADHALLAGLAGMTPEAVSPLRYGPAVSPHLAAELAGERIEPQAMIAAAHAVAASEAGATTIVEGVGGLLTPLAEDFTVCDLALALGLPTVIAARPGLGTINHTLLTLAAARAAGLDVRAVVLTPWPERPTTMQLSNRATIARLGRIAVETLGTVASPAAADLAAAAAHLQLGI